MSEPTIVSVKGVAVELGVTLPHVYNLVRAERLPGAYKEGGEWRVPRSAIKTYIEKRSRRTRRETRMAA